MKAMLKCCFCGKLYDWYEGVHEKSGAFSRANCIVVKSFDPLPECEGEKLEFRDGEDVFNLCEDCMRGILERLGACH